ncbi:MAG TPA: uracil-DNA glycosylase [Candidatus Marinimicrobia bacterium]|nr:uracil-DNA glycosylase [Candidatus Neomarinimicrobiota bacterium]
MKWFFENGKLDGKWVNDYCFGDRTKCVRYKMEEDGRCHPDNMLPDGKIDERLQY